jgi:hypothetical protein
MIKKKNNNNNRINLRSKRRMTILNNVRVIDLYQFSFELLRWQLLQNERCWVDLLDNNIYLLITLDETRKNL